MAVNLYGQDYLIPITGTGGLTVVNGKLVCRQNISLQPGFHTFRLKGFPAGSYLVNLEPQYQSGSVAFISAGYKGTSGAIDYVGSDEITSLHISLKSSKGIVPMQYNADDQLLFTGSSDIFATVYPFVPTPNTEISFFFIEATYSDGNHYPIVTTGSRIWLARNLMTTKYTYGSAIDYPGGDNYTRQTNTTGAFLWYGNDKGNKGIYGALYNWYALDTSILCTNPWHVPTDEEWTTMTTFPGGMDIAGEKLKETGLLHWANPNLSGTFSCLVL